jgi:hypothetical protein
MNVIFDLQNERYQIELDAPSPEDETDVLEMLKIFLRITRRRRDTQAAVAPKPVDPLEPPF